MLLNKEINNIIRIALKEDIGPKDVTTAYSVRKSSVGKVVIIAREKGVLCGANVVSAVMRIVDKSLVVKTVKKDGDPLDTDDLVIEITGKLSSILTGERVAAPAGR